MALEPEEAVASGVLLVDALLEVEDAPLEVEDAAGSANDTKFTLVTDAAIAAAGP
eukprot:CAMPEP_0115134226 /NCGR_PEP_ID=MMETSP0227-20121206/54966_1 /TAXON_ID=89957 /ORGANISM="Polarella glacialis, Strain CCMP 1383" /LENGTH=54 /DNA_ID=CAMNT_0002540657 /DNA_START=199 /DNA_END=362 /DNA_ORIENTATION=-